MDNVCSAAGDLEDNLEIRVVDDLSPENLVTDAELDAVEAFLMPILARLHDDH